jgi:hypothetical protein
MRRMLNLLLFFVLALTVSATAIAGQQTSTRSSVSCSGAVSWQTAKSVVGRYATIKGRVAGTTFASFSNGSPTFLDIGASYPSTKRVTVVIWIENRNKFGAPEAKYKGHTICVHGYVDSYDGVPEIEAKAPSQILVTR